MCVLGCVAFVHMPKETRTKLNSKDVKCIFIDYYEEIRGCKLHNPINQYVIVNYDVIFDEYKNFNVETMVSRLDYRSKYMV